MSRLLVIGGSGVIGHFVVRSLIGARAPGQSCCPRPDGRRSSPTILDRIDLAAGEMTDRAALSELIRERSIGRIAHLRRDPPTTPPNGAPPAAVARPSKGIAGLLDDAAPLGVERVVFASSKAVYGPVEGTMPTRPTTRLPEDFPLRPASMYGITKLSAEMGAMVRRNRGIEFAAVRFDRPSVPGKLLPATRNTSIHSRIIESAMRAGRSNIPRGGDRRQTDIRLQRRHRRRKSACLPHGRSTGCN